MDNKELIFKIDNLFKQINVKYAVIQEKHMQDNIFYPGYIYIIDWPFLDDDKNNFINENIYPILEENNWEVFFYMSESEFTINDIMSYFPISE